MHIQDIMLPTETERQQIFHYLKKISSVTAWQRILEFYEAWVNVAKNSLQEADKRGWGKISALSALSYAGLLKGLAHCEEGIRRLKKGDKQVFKFDANGEFAMAGREPDHYSELLHRLEIGENRINEEHTPLWDEFCSALDALCRAWGECGVIILEPRYEDEPALLPYNDWLRNLLLNAPFPPALAPVPDPKDNVFIRTGALAPCSGIWEPIDSPEPSTIMRLLGKAEKPQPPFTRMGCMNYLHGDSPAPTVRAYVNNEGNNIPTTWRLLWRDDRYRDGSIPEEEKFYRFTAPAAKQSPWSAGDQI